MAYAIVLQTVECVVSLGFSLVSPMEQLSSEQTLDRVLDMVVHIA